MTNSNPTPENHGPDGPDPEFIRRRLVAGLVLPIPFAIIVLALRIYAPDFLLNVYPREIDSRLSRQHALDFIVYAGVAGSLFLSVTAAVIGYLQTGHIPLPDFLRRWLSASPQKQNVFPQEQVGPPLPEVNVSVPRTLPAPLLPELETERFRYITIHAEELVGRLSKAVEQQRQRNNINVGFGFFITLIGVSVLIYFVQDSKAAIDPAHPLSALAFLPRLSLVVLIELFAYFFLNLYRDGLTEMKYLQNELTTIRMRTLGLRAAIVEGHESSAAEIMLAFANTDRNATVGKAKATADNATELLKTAQEAIKVAAKLTGGKPAKD